MIEEIFIDKPLLPQNDVTLCAVSADAGDIIAGLESFGIRVLKVSASSALPVQVRGHADMQVLPLGGKLVAVDGNQTDLIKKLRDESFDVIAVGEVGDKYPSDCRLNVLPVGKRLVCNRRAVAKEILALEKFEPVHVNQGYTRCSSILINDDTVLTDDVSIGKTVLNFAKYSIIMKQNEIVLEGYDHGFIGGSCGKLAEDLIVFAGRIPDTTFGNSLRKELSALRIRILEIGERPLRDIGGIIPLKQRSKRSDN